MRGNRRSLYALAYTAMFVVVVVAILLVVTDVSATREAFAILQGLGS